MLDIKEIVENCGGGIQMYQHTVKTVDTKDLADEDFMNHKRMELARAVGEFAHVQNCIEPYLVEGKDIFGPNTDKAELHAEVFVLSRKQMEVFINNIINQ